MVNHNRYPSPLFFVIVASKGLSQAVSLLFATLAGRSISVAVEGLRADGEVESRTLKVERERRTYRPDQGGANAARRGGAERRLVVRRGGSGVENSRLMIL